MCTRVLIHVYEERKQVYITHMPSHWVQVQSTQPEGCSHSMCRWAHERTRKHHRDKELVSQLCVTFYWNRKSREVTGTKKKKRERENEREAIVMVGSFAVRSLGAEGELLQVMDALLVNQTDGKGGEIQDEAFVELWEGERADTGGNLSTK